MAADDDGDVFEITDFTTASEWERFISRVEEILHEWKLISCLCKGPAIKGAYANGVWEEKTEELSFADFKFSLIHIWLKAKDEKREKSAEKESGDDEENDDREVTPTVYGDLMDMENDFPSRAHCLCRWYGLQDFVILTPANNSDAVLGESKIKLLLSSVNIALTDAGCCVPMFVQAHQKWRRLYQGTCVLPSANIEFGMVQLKRTPPQYNHLAGLLDVFKAKMGSVADPRPPVSVAVRFLYELCDWVNSPWSQPLPDFDDEVGCKGFDQLPFGACEDPVCSLSLYCTWPCLSEDMIVENHVYSDLDPLQAPHWSVRIQMTEDPLCLLGEYLSTFLALCHRKETLEQLLSGFGTEMREDSTGDISNALQRLTEPTVGYNLHVPTLTSYVSQPQKPTRKSKDAPIQGELLDQILQFLFPDSVKPSDNSSTETEENTSTVQQPSHPVKELPKQLKSAPVNGLLHKLAVCLCVLNQNNGGFMAVVQIWQEFILEMRYRWEHNYLIEGIEPGPPNLGSCLLQQKLQMLNCCIEHKRKRETLHKGYTGVPESPPSSPYRGPSTSQLSRSLSHNEAENVDQSDALNPIAENDQASGSQSESVAENSNQTNDSKTKKGPGSQKIGSSGESSDEEFFECNDSDGDQLGEKDEDTSERNQTEESMLEGAEDTENQSGDENEAEIDENQSETEMECEPVNISQTGSLAGSMTGSEIQEMVGTDARHSISNTSVLSDSAYKDSFSHKPEGRLALFQDLKLINCDERMYIPVTQEPAPMTEDMLEEHAEVLAKLGTSAEGAELRARMQSACLLSDMESFKAANPGCVLEDFVRWYSPRDWIEETIQDENGVKTEGHLSQRMQIPGNMWVEVWQTARPVPARKQKRLFDDTKEAEKVLHFLSSLNLSDIVVHLMPMLIHAALLKAMDNDDPSINVLKQVIEQACLKASQVTRSPQQDAKRYEELIRIIMQAEIIIARNLSLRSKFTTDLLEREDAQQELEHFVVTILQNSEVPVRGGPMGPAGSVISKLFQSAQRASYMILDEEESDERMDDDEESRLNSSVPNFPRPLAREYILRTFVPRPAPYSKQLPQRMFCSIEEDDFRIAGAFTSDSVFQ
ncbi:Rab3 GTPase-activating protein catalytic subunit [Mactra antiquata]